MANYKRRKKHAPTKTAPNDVEQTTDQLLAFERFRTEIAPELQEMLYQGKGTKEILKKFESYAAAKILTIALTEQDSGKALAAAKDILDRSHGKATETKKIQHQLADVEDRDLDALIMSELSDDVLDAEFEELEDED